MSFKVMLSYSWRNSAERSALSSRLGTIPGVEVLYDRKDIAIGDTIHCSILKLLDRADCLVVLLTEHGLSSKEVLDELTRAHERHKHIIPIVAENVALESLPWYLRDVNVIRYSSRAFDVVLAETETAIRGVANVTPRFEATRTHDTTEMPATEVVQPSRDSMHQMAEGAFLATPSVQQERHPSRRTALRLKAIVAIAAGLVASFLLAPALLNRLNWPLSGHRSTTEPGPDSPTDRRGRDDQGTKSQLMSETVMRAEPLPAGIPDNAQSPEAMVAQARSVVEPEPRAASGNDQARRPQLDVSTYHAFLVGSQAYRQGDCTATHVPNSTFSR